MLDFLRVSHREPKKDYVEIYPKFKVMKSKDLMIRGKDFYAIWDQEAGYWSQDEADVIRLIDKELDLYQEEHSDWFKDKRVNVLYLWDGDSAMIDKWHRYVQKQMRDNWTPLDATLIFADQERKKENYSTMCLPYTLCSHETPVYDSLISVLYDEENRKKIEWAIGAVLSGDSKKIQKFMVFYGAPGTGKGTILNLIQMLFEVDENHRYWQPFESADLTSNSSFALETLKANPLIAIEHDGKLSKIENNNRLNSIVSHEVMTINEKFKSPYSIRFNSFLFIGTNDPVKITDGKSGLLRRLIDIRPTGKTLPQRTYKKAMSGLKFELGGIAQHCLDIYSNNKNIYDDYKPREMMFETNMFYSFMGELYYELSKKKGVSLASIWKDYKDYCDESRIDYRLPKYKFKAELKNYFDEFIADGRLDGEHVTNYYMGFKHELFEDQKKEEVEVIDISENWLKFDCTKSLFDEVAKDFPAQYANRKGTPKEPWDIVNTTLNDIFTSRVHYVLLPDKYVIVDFDLKNEKGEKDYALNLEAASKWPETYAELSKSGGGIHLVYIYSGDPGDLKNLYAPNVEVKVFRGKSAIRRKLTKCNDIPIKTISSGLPLKKGGKVVNWSGVQSEDHLRAIILKDLKKGSFPSTKQSVHHIYDMLENAYERGIQYDVSDLRQSVLNFAGKSTHHWLTCSELVTKMKFKSDVEFVGVDHGYSDDRLVFFDVEVFKNLFVIVWKFIDSDQCVRMINPSPEQVREFMRMKLAGFNNRRYDNHILYARKMGHSLYDLYECSVNIIDGKKDATFSNAYNASEIDVYDMCSKKQSLKKWEVELSKKKDGSEVPHQELDIPWDQEVPEELWDKVAEYCENDVRATEAVFKANIADFEAREMLVAMANIFAPNTRSVVNDTTNTLTGRIIFGDERNPQKEFVYTDLSKDFPTYKFENGKSTYRGEEIGEGGYVYSEPGIYYNVTTFDVASMHPNSAIQLNIFGDRYTKQFKMLVDLRLMIKHKEYDKARQLFDGALAPYLEDDAKAKNLAQALKIAINSVYGLTSAKFPNKFKDNRNVDNIVAKRGELFMVNLKHEVINRGFKVIHIKTDSIKIQDVTPELTDYILEYGKSYGYTFEVEARYKKMCLVNKAVYIAQEDDGKWTATGTQFQVPYVFKKLFSKEEITFSDLCETKSVKQGSLYLDMNETLSEDEHNYIFVGRVGLFCPIKPGCGGGELFRIKDGKAYAAAGTSGYRWLESEKVKALGKEKDIDLSYYDLLVDDAIKTINEFGDYNYFVSDFSEYMHIPEDAPEELPFL